MMTHAAGSRPHASLITQKSTRAVPTTRVAFALAIAHPMLACRPCEASRALADVGPHAAASVVATAADGSALGCVALGAPPAW